MYRIRPRRGCTAAVLALAVAVDSLTARDRVTVASHVIVAPFVAHVAAEHGLADPGADARAARPCGSTGTFLAIRQTRFSDAPIGALRRVS